MSNSREANSAAESVEEDTATDCAIKMERETMWDSDDKAILDGGMAARRIPNKRRIKNLG
jgi:hypothetical protein